MSQLTDACVCGKTAIVGAHSRAAHVRPDGIDAEAKGLIRIAMTPGGESYPLSVDETANLKAHIQTLQGRLEALERARTADREMHLKVRRAIGQLAAAVGLLSK